MTLLRPEWLLVVACAVGACSERDDVPNASAGGTIVPRGTPDRPRDAGGDADADAARDAGRSDAGLTWPVSSCALVPVSRTDVDDATNITATERPADFLVTRQAETWSDGCEDPKLTLEFTGGDCFSSTRHRLAITLRVNDVEDNWITTGNNQVLPDADARGIQIRYERPLTSPPAGVWGTCSEASGQLVFLEAPDLTAGARLQARYELTLPGCTGAESEAQLVVGSFNYILHYGVASLCPDRSR
ncbi:MAG: hypothetical protein ABW321_16395 [Polyangiales bacterium]